jgi:predicted DNA-binding ribbon-helix-helix protein
MKSQVIKRSVMIDGHRTSISLEDAFWSSLKAIAQAQGATVAQTVTTIDKTRGAGQFVLRGPSICTRLRPQWTNG